MLRLELDYVHILLMTVRRKYLTGPRIWLATKCSSVYYWLYNAANVGIRIAARIWLAAGLGCLSTWQRIGDSIFEVHFFNAELQAMVQSDSKLT